MKISQLCFQVAIASGLQQLDATYNPQWLEVEDAPGGAVADDALQDGVLG